MTKKYAIEESNKDKKETEQNQKEYQELQVIGDWTTRIELSGEPLDFV